MRKHFPDDQTMRLCPETIYRALLLREGQGLHKRFSVKLRTGRRVRKTRWRRRIGRASRIINVTMIDQRPAEVENREQAGHWEGDLIVGLGSISAMMTLRERKTQYGIIVNLPKDHTAASVNAAAIAVFETLPPHLKRTLTWDQGVEMAWHEKLIQATGDPVYFAERSSPWATSLFTAPSTLPTSCASSTNGLGTPWTTTPPRPACKPNATRRPAHCDSL